MRDRNEAIVAARFGLTNGQPKTLEDVGRLYGLSRQRIFQIQKKAIKNRPELATRRLPSFHVKPYPATLANLKLLRSLPKQKFNGARIAAATGLSANQIQWLLSKYEIPTLIRDPKCRRNQTLSVEQHLWATFEYHVLPRLKIEGECVIAQSCLDMNGYPTMRFRGKRCRVTTAIMILQGKCSTTERVIVGHSCGARNCVRPDHLLIKRRPAEPPRQFPARTRRKQMPVRSIPSSRRMRVLSVTP